MRAPLPLHFAASLAWAAPAGAAGPVPIIFDTDFAMPPQDDGLALILALNSPELQILGITTVAGNYSVERANADALRLLEIAGRTELKVYAGADMPLLHRKTPWVDGRHGEWWSDAPPPAPSGGFARKTLESQSGVEFMLRTVLSRPGEVTIVALGPLTNVAMAIRLHPDFARAVKQIVIMGGAIASLPDGAGNMTPNAEFNFWVDPEAARIVLRSAIPAIQLSPLNVSRKTALTRAWYEKLVAVDTPITRLIRERMDARYRENPDARALMYDQVAVASVADPTLVKTRELYVDVDISPGPGYGTSVGGTEPWAGADDARTVQVQYDIDWERFIRMYVERTTKPVPGSQP
jgi:inosine-uridine nucleoside N-ribohydrolase